MNQLQAVGGASNRKRNMALLNVWRHADRMYQALTNAWNCGCMSSHQAEMMLEHRTSSDGTFRFLFEYRTTRWQDASDADNTGQKRKP
jgi:hypothetical protein